jgi:hypothetical protein
MKKLLFALTFLVLCCSVVCFFWFKNSNVPLANIESIDKTKNMESSVEAEEQQSIEEIAYKIGYNQGERAFMLQTMDPKAEPIDFKDEQYTVALEMSPEQKKSYQDNIDRGYVDGYHRGCEKFSCPGKGY